MSWIFGYKKPVSDLPPQGSGVPPSDGSSPLSNDKPSGGNASRESFYKFDSTALERAAQAAKELERSRKYHILKSILNFLSFKNMQIKHLMLLKCKNKLNN